MPVTEIVLYRDRHREFEAVIGDVRVKVARVKGGTKLGSVPLGVTAPPGVTIDRAERAERRQRKDAAKGGGA